MLVFGYVSLHPSPAVCKRLIVDAWRHSCGELHQLWLNHLHYRNLPHSFKCSAARVFLLHGLYTQCEWFALRRFIICQVFSGVNIGWQRGPLLFCICRCLKIFCFFADLKACQLWSSHAHLDVFCSVSLLCVLKGLIFTQGYGVLINPLCSIGSFQSKGRLNLSVEL